MTSPRSTYSLVRAKHLASHTSTISTSRTVIVGNLVLLACALVAPSLLGTCKCRSANPDDTTRSGANEVVVLQEKESRKQLSGWVETIVDGPREGVLVEVFDHPEYLLGDNPIAEHPDQKRLAACVTSEGGRFCFRHLPPGKYELRASLEGGWNITHVYVVLGKGGSNKKIRVEMKIGT